MVEWLKLKALSLNLSTTKKPKHGTYASEGGYVVSRQCNPAVPPLNVHPILDKNIMIGT
jgi:hypothetical protein